MGTNVNSQASNNPPTRLTGAEIVWATLEGEGVTQVFGYPGPKAFGIVDGPLVQRFILVQALDRSLRAELRRRSEDAILAQRRVDVLAGHRQSGAG